MTALVWYRNDLRVRDHGPLAAALAGGGTVRALWLFCEQQWDEHDVAPLRRWYMLESLRELGRSLAELGVSLDLLECGDFASAPKVLDEHVGRHGVHRVHCNREYPLNEMRRDWAVAATLEQRGVSLAWHDDGMLVSPEALRTVQGKPYTVFTPYRRSWDRQLDAGPLQLPGTPSPAGDPVSFQGEARIDSALEGLEVSTTARGIWSPGEAAALERLDRFVDEHLRDYAHCRDLPELDATSRLSPALSAGTLSPGRCYRLARQCADSEPAMAEGARAWISELAWRDFYRQIMVHFPRLARGEPFREEGNFLHWSHNDELFDAWCRGQTGFPLVDAAMRQLNETGWMHNRLRMLVAMFLTKHLFIHWGRGERYFMSRLIDGDFASNNGGWLWSASLGTDAVPYFRVFNPVRQSQRFDSRGAFIRRYVPELRELDDRNIHTPWKAPLLAPDYPSPLVELAGVRDRVSAAFREARQRAERERRR